MMAMFIVALPVTAATVFTIAAVGQQLIRKEVMTSSADAAAMAGAVVQAKALNFISFINVVMSSVLGLLSLLKGVTMGFTQFLGVAGGLCASHQFDYCGYIPKAAALRAKYDVAANAMQSHLRMLAAAERTMAKVTPALAMVSAFRAGTHPSFGAHLGVGLSVQGIPPKGLPMPVINAPWKELWQKAQSEKDKIRSIGLNLLTTINLGPHRPVLHAQAVVNLAIAAKNEAMKMEIDPLALPMRFDNAWRQLRFFRMQSGLSADEGGWRRGLAALGAPMGWHPPSLPKVSMSAAAQGEFFAFNGHADLWHMNWRARLSLSKPFVSIPAQLQRFWVH
jgi:hypothetical protein